MALTWGQGVDEDQYSAFGINPNQPDAWTRYMHLSGQLPDFVNSPDDMEAFNAGYVKTANGQWIDKGLAGDDYAEAMRQLQQHFAENQGSYFTQQMKDAERRAGYDRWLGDWKAAQAEVAQRLGAGTKATTPFDQLSFNRRRRADGIGLLDGDGVGQGGAVAGINNMIDAMARGGAGNFYSGDSLQRMLADYSAGTSGVRYSPQQIAAIGQFMDWRKQQGDRFGPGEQAQRGFADWMRNGQGDDWQGHTTNWMQASAPKPAAPPAAPQMPAAPPAAVTAQPGYQGSGSIAQAYQPQGLLGLRRQRPVTG